MLLINKLEKMNKQKIAINGKLEKKFQKFWKNAINGKLEKNKESFSK